jgi:hypothetical protein
MSPTKPAPFEIRLRCCQHCTWKDTRWGLSIAQRFATEERQRKAGSHAVYVQGGVARMFSGPAGDTHHRRLTATIHWTKGRNVSVRLVVALWAGGVPDVD